MPRSPFAPSLTEDEHADLVVHRGRNAGGVWIAASVASFGLGFAARSLSEFWLAWLVGAALLAVGLVARARYWRAARRRLGDATVQRAMWRRTEADRDGPERAIAAVVLVLLLLAYELWRK